VGVGPIFVGVGLKIPSVGAGVEVGFPGFVVGVSVEPGLGVAIAMGGSIAGLSGLSPSIISFWSLITSAIISLFT